MSSSPGNKPSAASQVEVALSCPICLENYCSIRYPIMSPSCGHSICVDCGKKGKTNVCVICKLENYFWVFDGSVGRPVQKRRSSETWTKNFALLDLVESVQMKEREMEKQSDIEFMDCFKCKSKEKRERIKICVTCAEKWNKEWKGMKEEEILPFILCAFCCHEEEEHRGHLLTSYLSWKFNEVLSTTVTNHQSTVSGMDELNHFEMERGKECVEIWKKEMNSCGSIDSMKCETYREGLSIVDVLNKECELVTRASEDCLPPLRKYSKIVKESTARIQQLKTGGAVEDGIEEDV